MLYCVKYRTLESVEMGKKQKTVLVEITSLGCAKNMVDTEAAAASLMLHGFGLTPEEKEADVKFINTCAFLAAARAELEEHLHHAAVWKKRKASTRKIIVGGCITAWDKDGSFRAAHPEVDLWTSIKTAAELGAVLEDLLSGNVATGAFCDAGKELDHTVPRLQLTPPHYAHLRVSDGCDNRCTYCKIPDIRGPLKSRTLEDVLAEAVNLLANGVKELIVIAQDTAAFGRDLTGKPQLAELLDELDKLDGDFLIRLMYLHPASVNDELIAAMSRCKHLIRCIEMPLQHISDHILLAMHRKAGGAATREVVKKLQNAGFAIRTTFMVGFPGETEEDFAELLEYVKETKFTRLGTFTFSAESGVPAAALPDPVPEKIAQERMETLMKAQAEISLKNNLSLIGKSVDVILDEVLTGGKGYGRMFTDAPEIDNIVQIRGLNARKHAEGDFVRMLVESATEYEIKGKLINTGAEKA